MADEGLFYRGSRTPYNLADFPAINLSTTSLMLWPSGGSPSSFRSGYWTGGRKMMITAMLRFTTAATPGNLTIEIRHGTTDNGGTILATSAATALAANKTNITCELMAMIESRADVVDTTTALLAWGKFIYDGASGLFTTTSQNPLLIPASAPASTNIDGTVDSAINIQFKRSGSTAEAVTVHSLTVESLAF